MERNLIDLHTHTYYSDGDLSPKQLINYAKENGVSTLSITDHDTIRGIKEIDIQKQPIKIIPGIELTAKSPYKQMHILGYGIDINDLTLNKKLEQLKEENIENILLMLAYLKKDYNIILPKNDIDEIFKNHGNIGRPNIAILLIKYSFVKEYQEAFDKYLIPIYKKMHAQKKGLSFEECIDIIKKAKGIPVLAHPNSLELEENKLTAIIKRMKNDGLVGIETIHSSFSKEEKNLYHKLAKKYELYETGGTDYHGPTAKPNIEIGTGKNNNVKIKKLEFLDKFNF